MHKTATLNEAIFNGDIETIIQIHGENPVMNSDSIRPEEIAEKSCSYEDFMKNIDNPSKFLN
jgi:hypothetical protein